VSAPLLSVESLAVAFDEREALTDVSFSVAPRSCLAIVGETGSGKSLTCRTLVGLQDRVDARITRGTIHFDGRDLRQLDERSWQRLRGREIALVPQASLSSMDPVSRVGRQLEEAIAALDPDADRHRRAIELMEQVDMPRPEQTLRRYPHQLSGGMRQRAMIALALAGRPRLLLADEPTTALDVTVQRKILRLLSAIRDQTDMALILITHDLGVARTVADQVMILYAGKTVEAGPIDEVFERPLHPYTQALLAAQPTHALLSGRLTAIRGAPPEAGQRADGCPFADRCPKVIDRCRRRPPDLLETGEQPRSVACIRATPEVREVV
jgi:oligopeptide/dipeptide ABC transporter ATP-binding protein